VSMISPRPGAPRLWTALFALVGLTLACSGGTSSAPEASGPRPVPEYALEDFLDNTSVTGASFSPDGTKILVSSNETGIINAYAIPVAGGEPEALTHSTEESVSAVSYFPADERFLYLSDEGGNELDHLYVRGLDGAVRDLTPGENLKADFVGWAADDRSFFAVTNERDSRYFDIYQYGVDSYERTLVFQNDEGLVPGAISPDERYLAFTRTYHRTNSDVLLYDRQSREMKNLTAHSGDVASFPQAFSPDGTSLFYTTDEGSEFQHLVRLDLTTSERHEVLRPDWDVSYAYVSRDGRYLVVAVNEDARNRLRLFEFPDLGEVSLPELPGLDITSVTFSRDSSRLAFYADSSRAPRNLYVYDLAGGEPRKLTQTLNPNIDPQDLVEAEVVRFTSFDGVEIPGLLYQPHVASSEHKVPALVLVHGGPGGQSRVGYNGLVQYLLNQGYALYAINNRGSGGYGKTFFQLDDHNHGQGDLDDCVASKQMLAATGWVDAERIGILGGSYGGYMVLAALTFRPEEFGVGVDLWGISNWQRTLASIPPWWEVVREALYKELGNPVTEEEYLRSISPLFHSEKIRRPLMVVQGANDPRVLQQESDDIVAAVRANRVPVEYLVFDDEGHGLAKKENQQEAYRAIVTFLDTHLAGKPPSEPAPGEPES